MIWPANKSKGAQVKKEQNKDAPNTLTPLTRQRNNQATEIIIVASAMTEAS